MMLCVRSRRFVATGQTCEHFFSPCVPKIGHKHQDCCVSLQNQHERNKNNNDDDEQKKNDTKTQ